jgi:putative restriction endonuclease
MNSYNKDIQYYEQLFSQIQRGQNAYEKHNKLSPYKPIFLLSIIELIENGKIDANQITTNGSDYIELEETFKKYLKLLGGKYKDNKDVFHQPFENLRNDKHKESGKPFWHLELKDKSVKIEDIKDAENRNRFKTKKNLKDLVEYGRFDDELWEILQDVESRQYLVDVLMHTFFAEEMKTQIDDIINSFNQDAEKQNQYLTEPKDSIQKHRTRKYIVRDSFFRKSVIRLYDYQCAVCRLSIKIKPIGLSYYKYILDAAHIIPLSVAYNNQINNGISLCKNHHWAFDYGCFTVDDNYKILVNNELEEECPHAKPMKDFHGEKLLLPNQENFFPDQQSLEWHRQNVFQG